ncbi:hypothetical protein XELAEV_18041251mg [Xenopus laevis]|uniref:Uncharacterized protein n=1 Tax=Xenopus laevis TaxID=8355 RepID=A0A974C313_XENLA|nr:hypothetical protein XELAEV_18041251mg [Xenopus laevis]
MKQALWAQNYTKIGHTRQKDAVLQLINFYLKTFGVEEQERLKAKVNSDIKKHTHKSRMVSVYCWHYKVK